MSTRISRFALALALVLWACAPQSGAPDGDNIECALEEGAPFLSNCVLEVRGPGRFIIHHPDDTFQRVRFNSKTGRLRAADGAQELTLAIDPPAGMVEFSVGSARYRLDRSALAVAK